jgi:hypothetical protein
MLEGGASSVFLTLRTNHLRLSTAQVFDDLAGVLQIFLSRQQQHVSP